jgi:hypothetical protein
MLRARIRFWLILVGAIVTVVLCATAIWGWYFVRAEIAEIEAETRQYESLFDEQRVAVTQANGNLLAIALSNYKRDHGVYPEQLADLVPAYCVAIVPPVAGRAEWGYDRTADKKSGYTLAFGAGKHFYPMRFRRADDNKWYLDN